MCFYIARCWTKGHYWFEVGLYNPDGFKKNQNKTFLWLFFYRRVNKKRNKPIHVHITMLRHCNSSIVKVKLLTNSSATTAMNLNRGWRHKLPNKSVASVYKLQRFMDKYCKNNNLSPLQYSPPSSPCSNGFLSATVLWKCVCQKQSAGSALQI